MTKVELIKENRELRENIQEANQTIAELIELLVDVTTPEVAERLASECGITMHKIDKANVMN